MSNIQQYDYINWKKKCKNKIKELLGYQILRPRLTSTVSVDAIKKIIKKAGLEKEENGDISWFYTAYDRGDSDPLTNYNLDFIEQKISAQSKVLITGCGTGIMLFYLLDKGYLFVDGFDYLNECVFVANEVKKIGNYKTNIWRDDGFSPNITNEYDLVTAMHWVFSAWMGNYGNKKFSNKEVFNQEFRNELLDSLLKKYKKALKSNGILILELTDSVADYRLESDVNYLGDSEKLMDIYPVRFSPKDVSIVAAKNQMKILDYKMCCSYGHQPRVSYIIQSVFDA